MTEIQTVTGPIDSADLGRTLMHEHLVIGWPGWKSATHGRDVELTLEVIAAAAALETESSSLTILSGVGGGIRCPSDLANWWLNDSCPPSSRASRLRRPDV